jgi:uncharacterized protein
VTIVVNDGPYYRLFWLRHKEDALETALDKLSSSMPAALGALQWSDLEILQLKRASILIEPSSGSWVAVTPRCSSLSAFKKLLGKPAGMRHQLAAYLFRRNILASTGGESFYPPTIETPEGRNLPENYLFVVETTERCNLGCLYCFKSASPAGKNMTEDTARSVAKYIALFKDHPVTVDFSGGEPTLNLKAIEIIASELSKKVPHARFSMQTNATMVNDAVIALARKHNIIVGSSLEGSVENLRELRPFANKRDASRKILNGIRRLSKEKVFGGVVSSFSDKVSGDHKAFIDTLDKAGITSLKLNLCAPLGRWKKKKDPGKSKAIIRAYFRYLTSFVEAGIARPKKIRESITGNICARILNRVPSYRCMNAPCDAGNTFHNIRINGDIFPCDRYSRFPDLRLGNIESVLAARRAPASGAAKNARDLACRLVSENKMVEALNKRTLCSVAACSVCNIRPFCGAGCGMESYSKFGSFKQVSAQCDFYKRYIPQVFEWLLNSPVFLNVYNRDVCDKIVFEMRNRPVKTPQEHQMETEKVTQLDRVGCRLPRIHWP